MPSATPTSPVGGDQPGSDEPGPGGLGDGVHGGAGRNLAGVAQAIAGVDAEPDGPHPGRGQQSAVALAEVLPVGVLLAGDDGSVLYANPALVEIFEASFPSSVADLSGHEAFRAADALWRATDGRRQRCTLPDGRILEGTWHRLAGGRSLTVTDATSDALIRRRLRQHNRALAELVATKTELVSALLHEVRTPLTAARTMASLLPESSGDDPVMAALARNLGRLEEVTREIATISGIENGTLDLRTEAVDLDRLLGEVGARLDPPVVFAVSGGAAVSGGGSPASPGGPAAPHSGPAGSPGVPAAFPGVPAASHGVPAASYDGSAPGDGSAAFAAGALASGDRRLLAEVFERLIAAVRAMGGGGAVTASVEGGQWRLGLPLPPDTPTDRLFTATGEHGNATALMFARAVIGRHDGSVGIEDEQLTVRLPLLSPARSSAPRRGSAGPAG